MLSKVKTAAGGIIVPGGGKCRSRPGHVKPPARWERDRPARKPTRDTSRAGTGQGIVPFDGLRERRVAAGKAGATNEIRTTPRGVCGDGRSATSRAYRACRAGFASRGTPVARGTAPSRSRLAPTRDMSLGSRRDQPRPEGRSVERVRDLQVVCAPRALELDRHGPQELDGLGECRDGTLGICAVRLRDDRVQPATKGGQRRNRVLEERAPDAELAAERAGAHRILKQASQLRDRIQYVAERDAPRL